MYEVRRAPAGGVYVDALETSKKDPILRVKKFFYAYPAKSPSASSEKIDYRGVLFSYLVASLFPFFL